MREDKKKREALREKERQQELLKEQERNKLEVSIHLYVFMSSQSKSTHICFTNVMIY